jgi:hypothetical protein
MQLGKRVLTGGVQAEELSDEESPLGIEHDLGDLLAGDLLPDVQVPDRGLWSRPRVPVNAGGLLDHVGC